MPSQWFVGLDIGGGGVYWNLDDPSEPGSFNGAGGIFNIRTSINYKMNRFSIGLGGKYDKIYVGELHNTINHDIVKKFDRGYIAQTKFFFIVEYDLFKRKNWSIGSAISAGLAHTKAGLDGSLSKNNPYFGISTYLKWNDHHKLTYSIRPYAEIQSIKNHTTSLQQHTVVDFGCAIGLQFVVF
ncbi:MAG TPA: hypothetical protein PLH27_03000 [bacterium]|nr:hypothetical protein [bacterium]HMY36006.1 hypothetical protein [bacterium]HMZ05529.1 hypothetical protein [bacterium]HNB09920.1 hypothetical protein [bacterium]HNB57080.1 hypothetical protein [bacterium]